MPKKAGCSVWESHFLICNIAIKVNRVEPCNPNSEGKQKTVPVSSEFKLWGKFQWNFDQGKGNLVRVSWEFELFEFELSSSVVSLHGTSHLQKIISNERVHTHKLIL